MRHPDKLAPRASPRLHVAVADVRDPESVARAVHADSVVLSGLGVVTGDAGTLTAGARALVEAAPARIL